MNRAVDPSYKYTLEYRTALSTSLPGRSFFKTTTGLLRISGFPGIEIGDVVPFHYGAQLPFVLRRHDGGKFQKKGACYVSGIMNGEMMDEEDQNRRSKV